MKTIENKKLIVTFIGIEFVLYAIFMSLDIMGKAAETSNIIKFISIVLCLAMSILIFLIYERFMDRVMLCIALSFTVVADIFLLFTEEFIVGVVIFGIVQLSYLARVSLVRSQMLRIEGRVYHRVRKENAFHVFGIQMLLRILCSGIILTMLYVIDVQLDALICVTVFYITNFIANIFMVSNVVKRQHYFQGDIRLGLFLVGLLLFFVCDIMVGLYNVAGYIALPGDTYQVIYQISSVGMWLFYLPGQVLITLS